MWEILLMKKFLNQLFSIKWTQSSSYQENVAKLSSLIECPIPDGDVNL